MWLLLILGCVKAPPLADALSDTQPAAARLDEEVRAAGYLPLPGRSSTIEPGALVMRSDGSLFLSREECFPEVEVATGSLAVADVTERLRVGVSASAGDLLRLLGGAGVDVDAGHGLMVAVSDLATWTVPIGALDPSPACLEALDRQLRGGVGLDAYLLITEVARAGGLDVRDASGVLVDAEGHVAAGLIRAEGEIRVERVSTQGFTVRGPVTLGYKCRQLVGLHSDGEVSNAGATEPCPGIGG